MNKEKPQNKRKIIVIGILILVIAFFAFYFSKREVSAPNGMDDVNSGADTNSETSAVTSDEDKAKQEEVYFDFLQEGLKYKSEGDAGNKDSYYKAIEAYQKAADVAEGKVWIPFFNLGNVYGYVGDYENAEKSYDKALEIAADSTIYLAKIQLYQFDLKKSEGEVGALYEDALLKTSDNIDIMTKYASYLRDIGNNEDSLKYWRIVSEKFPEDQRYKDEIAELEAKVKGE